MNKVLSKLNAQTIRLTAPLSLCYYLLYFILPVRQGIVGATRISLVFPSPLDLPPRVHWQLCLLYRKLNLYVMPLYKVCMVSMPQTHRLSLISSYPVVDHVKTKLVPLDD